MLRCVVAACTFAFATLASAQQYPTKPIRMIIAGVAGSSNFAARLIAPPLSTALGQQVIVDNRGTGLVVIETAARAAPDGYTLMLNGTTLWVTPFLHENVTYDPVRDFTPIILMIRAPNVVVVHPSVPVRSVKELIALARKQPGELNYATGVAGTSNHLAAALFKATARVNIVQINYKGVAFAITDLLAGQVQLMFPTPASVESHVRSGRLRALAVTGAQPSPLMPGLPTVAASGLPGYECVSLFGMFVPAKTPAAIVDRLNREIGAVLANAEVKERFLNAGNEVVGGQPQEFAAIIKSEMTRWGKVIREAGIRDR